MSPLRFFLLVPLQSRVMLCGLVGVALVGVVQVSVVPAAGRDAALTLLLLQMFSASSGFVIPARRGHYDPILTGGASRSAVVASHCALSIVPGVSAWLVLGLGEWLTGGHAVWSTGSAMALFLVSVGGWAGTVALPRLSGGVTWIVLMLACLSGPTAWRQGLLAAAAGGGAGEIRAAVYLVCPLVLAGRALGWQDVIVLLPACGVIVGGALAAWRFLLRLDVTLEAAQ